MIDAADLARCLRAYAEHAEVVGRSVVNGRELDRDLLRPRSPVGDAVARPGSLGSAVERVAYHHATTPTEFATASTNAAASLASVLLRGGESDLRARLRSVADDLDSGVPWEWLLRRLLGEGRSTRTGRETRWLSTFGLD